MMRSIGIVVFIIASIALLVGNILLVLFFGFQIFNLLIFILLLLNVFSIYMIFHITYWYISLFYNKAGDAHAWPGTIHKLIRRYK